MINLHLHALRLTLRARKPCRTSSAHRKQSTGAVHEASCQLDDFGRDFLLPGKAIELLKLFERAGGVGVCLRHRTGSRLVFRCIGKDDRLADPGEDEFLRELLHQPFRRHGHQRSLRSRRLGKTIVIERCEALVRDGFGRCSRLRMQQQHFRDITGRVAKLAIGRVEPIITQLSRFVNLLKSEEAPEQIVLIVDGPLAGKSEAFAQPQHRFEPGDRPARRFE